MKSRGHQKPNRLIGDAGNRPPHLPHDLFRSEGINNHGTCSGKDYAAVERRRNARCIVRVKIYIAATLDLPQATWPNSIGRRLAAGLGHLSVASTERKHMNMVRNTIFDSGILAGLCLDLL